MTQEKIETRLPFEGFYESTCDMVFDSEVESIFEYDLESLPKDKANDIKDKFYMSFNGWSLIHQKASKEWVEFVKDYLKEYHELDINLEFKELSSPREYNFTTDRIFADIPKQDMVKLINYVLENYKKSWVKIIEDSFTSCDGFISFYSNDSRYWEGQLNLWLRGDAESKVDHNIFCTFFETLMGRWGLEDVKGETDLTEDWIERVRDTCDVYDIVGSFIDKLKDDMDINPEMEARKA